ncbi:hypothetical protein OPKNFCMD_1382 [Methylobacterium crusticola]|uniref:Uncharacterized protein n=1 Tax=Methylobacterium crusticola TaxID=1697972 RepID=A0ABQ4QTV6_9HYPH|nr:hypothetical protein OPKNFCMD_1382 [Methylobacterium crusticola]
MPAEHSRHVAPTDPSAPRIDSQAATGKCASTGDATRAALRALRAQGEGGSVGRVPSSEPSPARGGA